jgi:hypothetical protein
MNSCIKHYWNDFAWYGEHYRERNAMV